MIDDDVATYYARRAAAEREMADKATTPVAAAAHAAIARAYEQRAGVIPLPAADPIDA